MRRELKNNAFAACFFLAATTCIAAANAPVVRPDVAASFKAAACAAEADARLDGAWSAKIFDAQIEGRRLSTRSGLPVETAQLERKAQSIARVKRYRGFATGTCDDGSAWIAAVPSPKPLTINAAGRLGLPTAALDAACESWRVDFAPAVGGAPQRITAANGTYTVKGDGTVGVTCQPSSPRWMGPVLWFLAPVGKGPAKELPDADMLTGEPRRALSLWTNRVRAAAKLPPLRWTDQMTAEAGILAIDSGLTHNRTLLKRVGESLTAQKVKLLGENRVRGKDVRAMAWLLWTSPRHRDLLLSPDATVAGLTQRDARGETLTVMLLGQDVPSPVAANAKAKAKIR